MSSDLPSHTSTMTVADVLGIPELVAGWTEVVVGEDRLDTLVRWVHVAESPRVAELLRGGELILTTGLGLGSEPGEIRAQIRRLADAGAAALLVETAVHWTTLPDEVKEECRAVGLPLLVSHREIRFVEITEQVHSRLLQSQFEQVTAMRDVSESFWALMHNSAPPEQLILNAARHLGCPVVLEDLSHRVVCFAEGHELPSSLLANWTEKSRQWARLTRDEGLIAEPIRLDDPDRPSDSWEFIDVQAQGNRWGRLFYRGYSANPAVGNLILRHAAGALAIERLGSADPHSWNDLIDRVSLDRLLHHRFTTVEGSRTVLAASGFPTTGRDLLALEFRSPTAPVDVDAVRVMITTRLLDARVLLRQDPEDVGRVQAALSLPPRTEASPGADPLDMLARHLTDLGGDVSVVVSNGLVGPVDLSSALHRVHSAHLPSGAAGRVVTLTGSPMDSLLHTLRGDVRVQAFAEETLGPLAEHDRRNGTDLLETLEVILRYPGSRSAAADALHLSRTALYSRISTIERLLAVNLADGDTHFELSLAIHSFHR